MMLQTGIPQ